MSTPPPIHQGNDYRPDSQVFKTIYCESGMIYALTYDQEKVDRIVRSVNALDPNCKALKRARGYVLAFVTDGRNSPKERRNACEDLLQIDEALAKASGKEDVG